MKDRPCRVDLAVDRDQAEKLKLDNKKALTKVSEYRETMLLMLLMIIIIIMMMILSLMHVSNIYLLFSLVLYFLFPFHT